MCGVKFQWLKSYADINQLFKRLKYYTGDLYLQIEPDDWVNTNSVYFDHARRVFNSVFLSDSSLVNPDIVSTPVKVSSSNCFRFEIISRNLSGVLESKSKNSAGVMPR